MLEKYQLPTHMYTQTYFNTLVENFSYISRLNEKTSLSDVPGGEILGLKELDSNTDVYVKDKTA